MYIVFLSGTAFYIHKFRSWNCGLINSLNIISIKDLTQTCMKPWTIISQRFNLISYLLNLSKERKSKSEVLCSPIAPPFDHSWKHAYETMPLFFARGRYLRGKKEGKGSSKVVVGLNRAICEGWRIFARGEKAPLRESLQALGGQGLKEKYHRERHCWFRQYLLSN